MARGSVKAQSIATGADAVGFLAKVLTDWPKNIDPLDVATALNLLAARGQALRKWGKVFFIGTATDPVLASDPKLPMAMIPVSSKVKFVRFQCNGTATPTVTFNIEVRADATPFTSGVVIFTLDKVATAASQSTTVINTPDVPARSTLFLDVGGISGSPETLIVTLEGELEDLD